MKRTFDEDLQRAVAFHGHLCAGQVLGTRVARMALDHFGIEDPDAYRDLIAIVETDRCMADAVCVVCGCRLGRRRLKWRDLGKMAATFYDMDSKEAIRISIVGQEHAPNGVDPVEFYGQFSDDRFFKLQHVRVKLTEEDLPSAAHASVTCEECGEKVTNGRHVVSEGRVLCKTCAGLDDYYEVIDEA